MPIEHINLSKNQKLPFSNIVKAGGFVYISGHTGSRDTEGNPLTTIESQTKQTMEKLNHTLEVAGVSFAEAVKTTVFLKNMEDFGAMNKVYGSYFGENKPVRSTIVCDLVSPAILVEIEMVLYSG
jgi:reactive intermediate/imine deaminase